VDYAGDQAYGGMAKEHSRSTKAVKATAGVVLTHNDKPILAMFSANSGGYTADAKAVFDLTKPYLVARKDPASLHGSMAKWTRKFSVAEVVSAMAKINIKADGLTAIEAAQRGPSGRIIKVRLVLGDGTRKVLRNRPTLRRALNLPEILHDIDKNGDTFIFHGHGWGHGVGYSQWGSAHMGKQKKYLEILAFYYGDVRPDKLW
jgi:stage II sporulation protein D